MRTLSFHMNKHLLYSGSIEYFFILNIYSFIHKISKNNNKIIHCLLLLWFNNLIWFLIYIKSITYYLSFSFTLFLSSCSRATTKRFLTWKNSVQLNHAWENSTFGAEITFPYQNYLIFNEFNNLLKLYWICNRNCET